LNFPYVVNQLGKLFVVLSAVMGVLAVMAWLIDVVQKQPVTWDAEAALLIGGALCLVVGGVAWGATYRCDRHLGRRDAMLLVAMSWLLGAAFAAVPFFVWSHLPTAEVADDHPFRSFVDCYFEAMSGLTTTGASVLTDIEAIPRELLLWRAFTHWIGGLGIVVLFVAVLPSVGVGGKKLFLIEAPGPAPEGLQPRIRDTVRILWLIYVGLTSIEVIALWTVGGMHIFDAVCHAFATLATGGFSSHNASLGHYYNTAAVDVIVIFFMVLAGANFGLYYRVWRRRSLSPLRDTELRLYLLMLLVGTLVVAGSLIASGEKIALTTGVEVEATPVESLRQSLVTTVSIQTTTGFGTSDFNRWPFLGQAVLILFMFVGGCSGSTAGGIKVIRIWIAVRVLATQVIRYARPNVTRAVRVAGTTVDTQFQLSTVIYVLGILVLFTLGWAGIMLLEQLNAASECSSVTAATASVATLCTIGPGLEGVGAVQNYGWFSWPSKLVMCMLMALGRLEVFAIIVLFKPGFWKTG
jgi:trk system potassium uptake protein TrkH